MQRGGGTRRSRRIGRAEKPGQIGAFYYISWISAIDLAQVSQPSVGVNLVPHSSHRGAHSFHKNRIALVTIFIPVSRLCIDRQPVARFGRFGLRLHDLSHGIDMNPGSPSGRESLFLRRIRFQWISRCATLNRQAFPPEPHEMIPDSMNDLYTGMVPR